MNAHASQYRNGWLGAYLGVLLMIAADHLQAENSIRTLNAAFLHYPPMAYLDENNQPAGSVIELTERIALQSGLRINWVTYPIRRIYKGLGSGEIDLWPGSQAIPVLRESTLETPSIGIEITLCAFSLADTAPIERLQDLTRSQLVLIRGYTYRGQLDTIIALNPRKPIIAPDHSAAMQVLERGRADYLISYNDPIERALLDYPQTHSKCNEIDRWPLVYVVSRQAPDAQKLVDILSEGYLAVSLTQSRRASFAQAR